MVTRHYGARMLQDDSRANSESEAIVEVRLVLGLHSRPAAMIHKLASYYRSEILISHLPTLYMNGKAVVQPDGDYIEQMNALSPMGLMALAAGPGARLKITASGPDAAEAVDCLKRYLQCEAPQNEREASVFRNQ